MLGLLKETYYRAENIKGKKLVYTFAAIFVVFSLVGIGIGNYINSTLPQDEATQIVPIVEETKKEIIGKVAHTNFELYPYKNDKDKINYVLLDSSGKEIILLKSKDQKLSIVEGLTVKAMGTVQKLEGTDKEVFVVEEVTINASN